MTVKSSQSGARMLTVIETIARHQPIGSSDIARHLHEDKSAIQRSLATLSRAGWIARTDEPRARWELSAHLYSLAQLPQSGEDLRQRARPLLQELSRSTGETAFLALRDTSSLVVIDVCESAQMLRTSLSIGQPIQSGHSATGKAVLAWLDDEQRHAMLNRDPDDDERMQYDEIRKLGYSVSIDEVVAGSTNLAAPIFDGKGHPHSALGISAPTNRLAPGLHAGIGKQLSDCATRLSRKLPKAPA